MVRMPLLDLYLLSMEKCCSPHKAIVIPHYTIASLRLDIAVRPLYIAPTRTSTHQVWRTANTTLPSCIAELTTYAPYALGTNTRRETLTAYVWVTPSVGGHTLPPPEWSPVCPARKSRRDDNVVEPP